MRRPRTGLGGQTGIPGRSQQPVPVDQAGTGDQMGAGTLVIGLQRRAGLREVAAEGRGERLDHPAGMGGDHRQMTDRIVVITGRRQQHREITTALGHPGGDPAQHRVGEPYRPLAAGTADQVDG